VLYNCIKIYIITDSKNNLSFKDFISKYFLLGLKHLKGRKYATGTNIKRKVRRKISG
jgi:hypothetical protein